MNVFLTGPIQIGKSTAIKRYLSQRGDVRLGGFVTVSRPLEGDTIGVYIQPPVFEESACDEAHLAGLRGGRRGGIPETFETTGMAILSAPGPFDLLLMDELGRMELRSPAFCQRVLALLEGDTPILGVVKPESNALLDAVRAYPKTVLLEVTEENRSEIPALIARHLDI